MVIHFKSYGNFTTGIASYRALISKKSKGTLKLTDKAFSFKSEKDEILFEIKIIDIHNFYLHKRFTIPTIELQTKQGLQINFYPRKMDENSPSSTSKLTIELFRELARLVYKKNQPILFETYAGLWNEHVSDINNGMDPGIILLTEDYLSFKSYTSKPALQISIKKILRITFEESNKDSPIKVQTFEKDIINLICLKKQLGRIVNNKIRTKKLYEMLCQAKIYKNSEQIRLKKEEEERIQRIKSIFEVSNKIRLDMVRTALEMDEKTFTKKIFQWARQFKFIIDGDYLVINSDTINEFLENLKMGFDLSIRRDLKKICINCGESIDFTAQICPHCGKEQVL